MNSEKVKEIKKALEHCAEKLTCQGCPEYNNEPVIDLFQCKTNLALQIIALFNELESEKCKYKDLYETMYKKYAKLEAETYTKKDVKQLKDRIAELEKENGYLAEECQKLNGKLMNMVRAIAPTEWKLQRFAERLKEKSHLAYDMDGYVWVKDIYETLKEFIDVDK